LHRNNLFLELEQSCVPNSTTCSTNSTAELLHGGVRGVELEKRQRSSPKHLNRLQNMDSSSVGVALRCATLLCQNTASIPWVAEAPFCLALFAWTYQPYYFSEIIVFSLTINQYQHQHQSFFQSAEQGLCMFFRVESFNATLVVVNCVYVTICLSYLL
jgi:hypothetical protein